MVYVSFGPDGKSAQASLSPFEGALEVEGDVLAGRYILDNGVPRVMTSEEHAEELLVAAIAIDGARARAERDRLLSMSDWTQAADAPVDGQAWRVYRQALRDVPQQAGFPYQIVWPQKP